MVPITLETLAEKIADGQATQNWETKLILVVLVALTFAGTTFFKRYFEKRADTLASKTDLAEIQSQLAANTKITTEIELSLSHRDWELKEYKTIRRAKLEEAFSILTDSQYWLQRQVIKSLDITALDKPPLDLFETQPISRFVTITCLYFRELDPITEKIKTSHDSVWNQILVGRASLIKLQYAVNRTKELMDKIVPLDSPEKIEEFSKLIKTYEHSTSQLSKEMDNHRDDLLNVYNQFIADANTFGEEAKRSMDMILTHE